jgi:UDP-glucose 4-epimerase
MKRVLVTGGSGRVGRMLRRGWAQHSADAACAQMQFVFQTRTATAEHALDFVWDGAGPLPAAARDAGPIDCMIVLAGVVPRVGADLNANRAIGEASLHAAAQLGIPAVLLASSSAVYGTRLTRGFHERDAPLPENDYGRAKLEMERACAPLAQALGVRLCALRIGNVAGADALLINAAALPEGRALRIDCFADGQTPLRSYIGPLTLCDVLCSLVQAGPALPGCLNIAAPHPVLMGALAQAAQVPVDLVAAQGTAHQHVTLDCAALDAFHAFPPAAATPQEMVRQWRATL